VGERSGEPTHQTEPATPGLGDLRVERSGGRLGKGGVAVSAFACMGSVWMGGSVTHVGWDIT